MIYHSQYYIDSSVWSILEEIPEAYKGFKRVEDNLKEKRLAVNLEKAIKQNKRFTYRLIVKKKP